MVKKGIDSSVILVFCVEGVRYQNVTNMHAKMRFQVQKRLTAFAKPTRLAVLFYLRCLK